MQLCPNYYFFLGLVTDDTFEAIIALNLGISLLSSETLAREHLNLAEKALDRFIVLCERLFGAEFSTLLVHQVIILVQSWALSV